MFAEFGIHCIVSLGPLPTSIITVFLPGLVSFYQHRITEADQRWVSAPSRQQQPRWHVNIFAEGTLDGRTCPRIHNTYLCEVGSLTIVQTCLSYQVGPHLEMRFARDFHRAVRGTWITKEGHFLQQQLVYTLIQDDFCARRSGLDGNLQGSSAAHLVQCLLVVLELKDVGDLVHRLQDHNFRISND